MTTRPAALALGVMLAACGGGEAPPDAAAPAAAGRAVALSAAPLRPARALAPVERGAPSADDEIVIMLSSGQSIQEVAGAYGLLVLARFGQRPIWRLRLGAGGATLEQTLALLAGDARVRFAERNVESQTPEARVNVVWAIGNPDAYARQWADPVIGLRQAQQLASGAGVRVAVLDTGVELVHPALAGRFASRADGSLLGRDFVDGDADPSEQGSVADAGFGHGTHVAGLVIRVAPAAKLMPVRVLEPSGRGNVWVLAEALMWAVDPDGDPATADGARIVNISIGTTQPTRLLDIALELATCSADDEDEDDDNTDDPGFDADRDRCNRWGGAVVMSAAGNGGSSTERQYPAAEGAVGQLAVTAINRARLLAGFANRGPWVQLAAPGDRIVSSVPGGEYGGWSGTSMAAPYAAGVAALLLQRHPDWKPDDVVQRLRDRSQRLCGQTQLRGLHAFGAVADFVPADPLCRE